MLYASYLLFTLNWGGFCCFLLNWFDDLWCQFGDFSVLQFFHNLGLHSDSTSDFLSIVDGFYNWWIVLSSTSSISVKLLVDLSIFEFLVIIMQISDFKNTAQNCVFRIIQFYKFLIITIWWDIYLCLATFLIPLAWALCPWLWDVWFFDLAILLKN